MRFVRRLYQLQFLDALDQEDQWVFNAHDDEFEGIFEPLVTNSYDLRQNLIAVHEMLDIILVVFSQYQAHTFPYKYRTAILDDINPLLEGLSIFTVQNLLHVFNQLLFSLVVDSHVIRLPLLLL